MQARNGIMPRNLTCFLSRVNSPVNFDPTNGPYLGQLTEPVAMAQMNGFYPQMDEMTMTPNALELLLSFLKPGSAVRGGRCFTRRSTRQIEN